MQRGPRGVVGMDFVVSLRRERSTELTPGSQSSGEPRFHVDISAGIGSVHAMV